MTTLKELTHDNHELAEAHPFTKLLLSGSIPENVYADFLYGLGVYTLAHKTLNHVHLLNQAPGIGLISGYVRTIFQAVRSSGRAS